jgi:hypothetical protein
MELDNKIKQTFESVQLRQEENRFNFKLFKEKDNIKRFNHMKNIEREKRKLEWKKLNVLAKEKINQERLLGTCYPLYLI